MRILSYNREFCTRPVGKDSFSAFITPEILLDKAPLGYHQGYSAVGDESAALNDASLPVVDLSLVFH